MKAYLAAPIFNEHQLAIVAGLKNMLEVFSFQVFSPYEASQGIWKGRAPKDCAPEERAEVLMGNVENLNYPTELLFAWVGGTEDGRVDTGVCWEMGYFHCRKRMGNPGFALAYIHPDDQRQAMNLMLAGTVDAVVHGPADASDALALYTTAGPSAVVHKYHPDKIIAHEREPIV